MASSDLRDVLNIPSDVSSGPRPTKKAKPSGPRPNLKGLAREVQSLGGDNPIAIVPSIPVFKKRRLASRKPAKRWELRPFHNSAREDQTLILRHWRQKASPATSVSDEQPVQSQQDDQTMRDATPQQSQAESARSEAPTEDSAFAKFNVQISTPQYSDDQYRINLQSPDWDKTETDYLLSLARTFDLRWPLIWDRYEYMPVATNGESTVDGGESKAIIPAPKTRSLEDLKARYYEVAAKMMIVQKPVQYMTQPEHALYELMTNFSATQERARKDFAANAMMRSREEAKEEESLLLEVKRILARNEIFNEERRELYNRLDYPHTDQDVSTFKTSAGLQNLLQNLMTADKSKKRKSAVTDGVSPATAGANASGVEAPTAAAARRESIAASTVPGPGHHHRDSIGSVTQTPTSATAGKKGGASAAATAERRKLTEQEEMVYGVSRHDRLSGGPTFRTERINKLFTSKSNQQQLRITNVLNELDIPSRLTMPTSAVVAKYEKLLSAIIALIDCRKTADKIDAEIKVELAKKTLREEVRKPASDKTDDATKPGSTQATEGDSKGEQTTGGDGTNATESSTDASAPTQGNDSGSQDNTENATEEAAPDAAEPNDAPDAAASAPTDPEDKDTEAEPTDESREGKDMAAGRPGSSGAHKRSASVLSAISDKSTKRLKK